MCDTKANLACVQVPPPHQQNLSPVLLREETVAVHGLSKWTYFINVTKKQA